MQTSRLISVTLAALMAASTSALAHSTKRVGGASADGAGGGMHAQIPKSATNSSGIDGLSSATATTNQQIAGGAAKKVEKDTSTLGTSYASGFTFNQSIDGTKPGTPPSGVPALAINKSAVGVTEYSAGQVNQNLGFDAAQKEINSAYGTAVLSGSYIVNQDIGGPAVK